MRALFHVINNRHWEAETDNTKVTKWNNTKRAVTLAYFQGKMYFFGKCFLIMQSNKIVVLFG